MLYVVKSRSPNKKKRTYVIGRRYLVEKEEKGGDRKSMRQNDALIEKDRTSKTIGDQLSLGYRTVERAADFTQAVDTVARVTCFT